MPYADGMPKLWNETIEAHRHAVREATLDTAAALVARDGLAAVTMSQIAEETGIGRATLYKYFPDVGSILIAWHERLIAAHLEHLAKIGERIADPGRRLAAVLEAYALMRYQHHHDELVRLLHRGKRVADAERRLRDFVRHLLAEAAATGKVRSDIPFDELTGYCLAALSASAERRSKEAIRRLVLVTLDGLAPRP
jgi:AcrR family transcriptional regulator